MIKAVHVVFQAVAYQHFDRARLPTFWWSPIWHTGTPTLQDFKEAARLSAEAKSAALEAEKRWELAQQLAEQALIVEERERAAILEVQERQAAVEGASLTLVRGRYHLLQVSCYPVPSGTVPSLLCRSLASP